MKEEGKMKKKGKNENTREKFSASVMREIDDYECTFFSFLNVISV